MKKNQFGEDSDEEEKDTKKLKRIQTFYQTYVPKSLIASTKLARKKSMRSQQVTKVIEKRKK